MIVTGYRRAKIAMMEIIHRIDQWKVEQITSIGFRHQKCGNKNTAKRQHQIQDDVGRLFDGFTEFGKPRHNQHKAKGKPDDQQIADRHDQ